MKIKIASLWLLVLATVLAGCGGETVSPTATVAVVAPTIAATTAAATITSTTGTTVEPTASATTAALTATTAPTSTTADATATTGSATTPTTAATATTGAATAESTATTAATTTSADTTPKIVAAANAFLATLSDSEKATALFDWTNEAQKSRWSNLPQGLYTRAGIMWGDMSENQQTAWLAVMAATLSAEGYDRVIKEWNADDALAAQQSGGGGGGQQLLFGTAYYFIAIIGTPSETDAWQWQWGGHHVTVNATIVGANLSLTPSFIGVQPATYTDASGNTIRPLGDIEDEAFALINALDATQQTEAILGATAIDLVLGPGQDGKTIASEGLPASEMTADQRAMFLTLIGEYTNLANDEDAAARMAEIQADLDSTYFAWYGPTTEGSSAYFRITGPTIVVEYSPQNGGGQGSSVQGPQHIHGIYRDPTNDYGAKYTQ